MTAKVSSSSGRTLKELPAWRSDVWLRDVCLRVTLYDFFLKESRSLKLANRPSVLLHRYKQSHALAIGLECIHEFVMPFCSTPWWACSICYKADASLDVLDDHLHSIPHIKTYIDEFHPGRVIDESLDRFTLIDKLYTMRLELLEEQGKLESPEVLNVEGATKEWAIQKLAIVENMNDLPYKIGELFGGHEALHCKVCHSTIASVEQKRERCWETHITSSYHQRMQMLASTISQFDSHRIDNPIDVHMNKWQQNASGTYVGPVAGLQYLLFFGSFSLTLLVVPPSAYVKKMLHEAMR
ncbi:unnamed protein product [Toxocara canis]|uniref:C2H2-type domain-containing protein n=1 Tax=Toxocara canis TaxID=6265 RepID=A0A183UMZ8_TOXCA|nr:unnamed protein product [Toxocara canis]